MTTQIQTNTALITITPEDVKILRQLNPERFTTLQGLTNTSEDHLNSMVYRGLIYSKNISTPDHVINGYSITYSVDGQLRSR